MRNVHSFGFTAVLYVAYIMLAGCATLGVPQADTFNKKAAAAVVSVNAASQLTLTLLQARKITPDESDAYISRTAEAQKAIGLTRSVYKTDPSGAEDNLTKIVNALAVLTAELERRK